jgi:cell division protein FtsB
MRDFTKRGSRRGNLVRRFYLGALVVAILGFVTFNAVHAAWGMYGKFAEAASGNDAAQQNLTQLKEQEAGVEAEVASLSSKEGQEAQLRQSYGVALPGEGEIQIVHAVSSTSVSKVAAPGNFFMRTLRALFVW